MHFFGLQVAVKQLDISTATVNVLLVLDRVLDDQVLVVVGERWELLGQCIEPSVLWRLYTLVGFGVVIERARAVHELAELLARMLRVRPLILPWTCGQNTHVKPVSGGNARGIAITIIITDGIWREMKPGIGKNSLFLLTVREVLLEIDFCADGQGGGQEEEYG